MHVLSNLISLFSICARKRLYPSPGNFHSFEKLMSESSRNPTKQQVESFVRENFENVDELINATLPDWRANPSIMERIHDPHYRAWVADLNEIWKTLARRMTTDVRDNPSRHSLIYVNNTFIIPGGRFKGMYEWEEKVCDAGRGCRLRWLERSSRPNMNIFLQRFIYTFQSEDQYNRKKGS